MLNELSSEEIGKVAGGVTQSTTVDPDTGETVVRDCSGNEISRSDAFGNPVYRVLI